MSSILLQPVGAGVCWYAMRALPPDEAAALEAHIASCALCQQELEALRPVADSFVGWPTNILRPAASLPERLAQRIAAETGGNPVLPAAQDLDEPAWEEVAPGIFCKLMANDTTRHRVSMLVRLLPGVEIRDTPMPAWRSCSSSMASYGLTTASSIPENTTEQSLSPATSECGARLVVPAFSSPALKTSWECLSESRSSESPMRRGGGRDDDDAAIHFHFTHQATLPIEDVRALVCHVDWRQLGEFLGRNRLAGLRR